MTVVRSPTTATAPPACYLCGGRDARLIADLRQRPTGETDFRIPPDQYRRQIHQCLGCDVFFSTHDMLPADVYRGTYNATTYAGRLLENFRKIRALPEECSDNKQRVRRVGRFLSERGRAPADTRVLDVGSGLCVFLAELKELGYDCYCVDPDPVAVRHALEHACVDGAYAGTLDECMFPEAFDLIALNKVLEHVADPVSMLATCRQWLKPGGAVYLEVPDGETSLAGQPLEGREEFYIEHHTVFTVPALRFLIEAAHFQPVEIGRLHEPSDKFTLFAFLTPAGALNGPDRAASSPSRRGPR